MTHATQTSHSTQHRPRCKRGHYVPHISRFLVAVLYHEGRRRGIPMTKLVDHLLSESLRDTPGWLQVQHAQHAQEAQQVPSPSHINS